MPGVRAHSKPVGVARMEALKSDIVVGDDPHTPPESPEKDEFGRLVSHTLTMVDPAAVQSPGPSSPYDSVGFLVSYGASVKPAHKPLPEGDARTRIFGMSERTLPGDLLARASDQPISERIAALVRQRSLDLTTLIGDYLRRPAFSRLPQRGHAYVDVPTFRRALCYAFGEQWTLLGMTTAEFEEVMLPYVGQEKSSSGDVLISWKTFAADMTRLAGICKDTRGYLAEQDSAELAAASLRASQFARIGGQRAPETEESKQAKIDLERVTGARSVPVSSAAAR